MQQQSQKKAVVAANIQQSTIAAIATASGAGGIGVVRVSGGLCRAIAIQILGHCPTPRHAAYLDFKQTNGELIDRGIAIFYAGPQSYTGEDVLELQAHGGTALMQILLARCIALGAQQAAPGEFTRRAYLNDKIDLAQAEAVADLINAATVEAAKSAVRSLSGEFSKKINVLLQKLIDLRLYVEACLDFPEEEIDFITQGRVAEKITENISAINLVLAQSKQGMLLRDGIQVVLIGQPNVGKSSLMNALAGEEVAIVTPIAGTTRDTIKSLIQINGVPLHIVDTAGLRETDDEVEKIGIARTYRATETAHIALILVDAAHGIGDAEKSILDRLPQEIAKIWVHNKIDLAQNDVPRETAKLQQVDSVAHVYLSAKTGEGLGLLKMQLLKLAGYQNNQEGALMARARHLDALNRVRDHLLNGFKNLIMPELVAEELKQAQNALSEITGEFTPDDLLGEIFSKFCIGK
jgi:tRNA modification GTPase